MQVAPQQAATCRQPGPHYPCAGAPARPPQVQARDHQHDAPAGSQFHQTVTDGADHQFAMQGTGDGLQVQLAVLFAEDLAAVRVNEDVHSRPPSCTTNCALRSAFNGGRYWPTWPWVGLVHLGQQRIGGLAMMAGFDHHQIAVQHWVELRLNR